MKSCLAFSTAGTSFISPPINRLGPPAAPGLPQYVADAPEKSGGLFAAVEIVGISTRPLKMNGRIAVQIENKFIGITLPN